MNTLSPWYVENPDKLPKPEVKKVNNTITFEFRNSYDSDKFLSSYKSRKPLLNTRANFSYDEIAMMHYEPELDTILYNTEIPEGYYRIYSPRVTFFVEVKLVDPLQKDLSNFGSLLDDLIRDDTSKDYM